jgi:ArsR family transcriptional regulator
VERIDLYGDWPLRMKKTPVTSTPVQSTRDIAAIFGCVSDPTRLRLLSLIAHNGETCVCDLMEATALPQTNVSRHLGILRRMGLVRGRKSGLWVYYSLEDANDPFRTQFIQLVRNAVSHSEELTLDLERLTESCCQVDASPLTIELPAAHTT